MLNNPSCCKSLTPRNARIDIEHYNHVLLQDRLGVTQHHVRQDNPLQGYKNRV